MTYTLRDGMRYALCGVLLTFGPSCGEESTPERDGPTSSQNVAPSPARCVGEAHSCFLQGYFGYCEAQAGCIPSSTCQGTDSACIDTLTETECIARGCIVENQCFGISRSCFLFSDSFDCRAQRGCYWSNNACIGSTRSCWALSEFECGSQEGCRLRTSCDGNNYSYCAALDPVECASDPWCSGMLGECGGQAVPCSEIVSEGNCYAQAGCWWQ